MLVNKINIKKINIKKSFEKDAFHSIYKDREIVLNFIQKREINFSFPSKILHLLTARCHNHSHINHIAQHPPKHNQAHQRQEHHA